MSEEWAARGQPILLCFGTVETVPVCMKWTINVHVFGMGIV